MLRQQWKQGLTACLLALLSACASKPTTPVGAYSTINKEHLYQVKQWRLDGRLAISSSKDSWSARIEWMHSADSEQLRLFGPLGQGAVAVSLSGDNVKIDRGGGHVQTSNQPEQFINQQLGMFVPLKSLRFWVIGLPEPGRDFQLTADGFLQSGWLVDYREMQKIGQETMPQKLIITNQKVKLKLIVDQWSLRDESVN